MGGGGKKIPGNFRTYYMDGSGSTMLSLCFTDIFQQTVVPEPNFEKYVKRMILDLELCSVMSSFCQLTRNFIKPFMSK